MDKQPEVTIYPDRAELAQALGHHIIRLAKISAAAYGRFYIALSGGSLIDSLSSALGTVPLRDTVNWSSWHVFWVDERWVSLHSPESNFRRAKQHFFKHVRIPRNQIYAMDSSLAPDDTARAYESALAELFQPGHGQLPRFDLILLGVGEDGHTASLFPGHPFSSDTRRWVVPVLDAPKPPPIRMTMTLPLINNARHIAFVAVGSGKAKIVSTLLNPALTQVSLPAGRVTPAQGALRWFVDRKAAALCSAPA